MKRRTVVRIAALAAALATFAPTPAAWAQPKELSFWTFLATQGTDPRSTALRNVVESFNKSQSKYVVKVESINFARLDNQVIQSTAAGQGPDILNVYSDQLPMHVAAKTIVPLDARYAALAAGQKDFVFDLDFFRFDGKLMALPWETRVWLLWYRKDLLDKAGVAVPRNTDQLQQAAAKTSTDQVMGFGFGASTGALGAGAMEAFIPLFWSAGGTLFDARGNATINTDAGVKVLTLFREMVEKSKGMRATVSGMSVEDAMTAVRAGSLGMTLMGSFRVGAARNAAATGQKLQTAPVPGLGASDKPAPARLAGQTLTIGANSKDPDGSWAFIQHYLSPASQLEFAKAGVMPSRSSSYADRFFKEDALAKDLQAWSDYAKQHGRMEKTPKDFSKLSEELAKAIQKVLVQGADPKAALDEAAAAYNAQRS
jgi:ABC-type glycerol-3-phosphate transport system substrate-binding protein